jgi:serine/threonine protein kinase
MHSFKAAKIRFYIPQSGFWLAVCYVSSLFFSVRGWNLAANYHKMGLSFCHMCADNPGVSQVLNIPRLPDHFLLGRKLGVGQFGEVFHATTIANGEEIAVKCVPIPATDTHIARVQREVQILRQTSHPGVVKYIDCYMNRGKVYIGMELCKGGNLKERLEKGKMSEEEGKKLIKQVLEALEHLHKHEIVHRDIKPENILFDLEGNAKITDFGLSRMMQAAQKMTIVGTPYYLAPEIRQGFYNEKCDIWSFGVVIYYTFVGKLPFRGTSIPAIVHKICTREITKWGEMSPGAIDFVGKMLQKDPSSRPSASELLQASWLNSPSASTSDGTLAVYP